MQEYLLELVVGGAVWQMASFQARTAELEMRTPEKLARPAYRDPPSRISGSRTANLLFRFSFSPTVLVLACVPFRAWQQPRAESREPQANCRKTDTLFLVALTQPHLTRVEGRGSMHWNSAIQSISFSFYIHTYIVLYFSRSNQSTGFTRSITFHLSLPLDS